MEFNFKDENERMRFYKNKLWRGVNGVRNKVLDRDNNECVWCKERGLVRTLQMGKLEVDHIKELEHCTFDEAIDINNCRTLCTYHHNERHDRFKGFHFQPNKWADDEKW
jgi:5-methylcytosine-specific restriction enzyme A